MNADPSRYVQVVTNLIQNSARYTPEKGEINVRVGSADGRALVTVEDNGIGISADLLPHVFELFVQGDAKPAGSEGGLGIGLTLVQHLMEQHGGTVAVASPGPGMGATFTLSLPLIAEPAAA
ncbi:sensor histidine kinase [Ramlibacter sp. Leaf400]|uniref:sensor histidine kinase n=1 Tax=Ramlibacter sp. Leaf400 TaxID=1736365 RepID=UPI0006F8DDFC|nr:ATP-binding protein [Ramlibacter sp. Leaf400]KQT11190.1 hypothetical protein ASG30_04715 [Ramlibacter sp. Leaf400]